MGNDLETVFREYEYWGYRRTSVFWWLGGVTLLGKEMESEKLKNDKAADGWGHKKIDKEWGWVYNIMDLETV